MTDAELFESFADLRILAGNILGFHVLAEDDNASEIGRIMAQSQIYSGSVDLAKLVCRIAAALQARTEEGPTDG
ncbi:hypothetical protein [Methylobacterium radiotolerans]|uniref:hypothetical protein n=1 Tax=Methylobacterium radiotolerans TaxID=31998 RepID=UPI0015F66CD5|nr:hypothetical protein [Methylobacterium radiotolerans]